MRRALWILAGLLAIQAVLFVVYLRVERARQGSAIAVERVDRPAPDLVLHSVQGATSRVSDHRGHTVVVHFWATWCPPCREELPSLLEFASSESVPLLAVSVDPAWNGVLSFVPPESHEHIYRAASDEAADAFGVVDLPQTFVIDPAGRLRLHFSGPQDWDAGALRAMIAGLDDG